MAFVARSPVPERPDVWRGDALGLGGPAPLPSGHAALDAELPGGGWPAAGLVELLQARPACHEWRLLLPALRALVSRPRQRVALIGAPEGLQPFAPALAAQGLPAARLLWVQTTEVKASLWAAEQALRCAEVPAVLAWLPQARPELLRRLHLVALDHGRPLFALRPALAQQESSAAPLRLLLGGGDVLEVLVFKRRGPPMAEPLQLQAHGPQLATLLALRRPSAPAMPPQAAPAHVLDRAVTA